MLTLLTVQKDVPKKFFLSVYMLYASLVADNREKPSWKQEKICKHVGFTEDGLEYGISILLGFGQNKSHL